MMWVTELLLGPWAKHLTLWLHWMYLSLLSKCKCIKIVSQIGGRKKKRSVFYVKRCLQVLRGRPYRSHSDLKHVELLERSKTPIPWTLNSLFISLYTVRVCTELWKSCKCESNPDWAAAIPTQSDFWSELWKEHRHIEGETNWRHGVSSVVWIRRQHCPHFQSDSCRMRQGQLGSVSSE